MRYALDAGKAPAGVVPARHGFSPPWSTWRQDYRRLFSSLGRVFGVSFAYLPWYTGDYLRDTRHLSPLKHGVYLLLLAHCWDQKGPVPLDEQEVAGIANCRSHDEIEAMRYILKRFFVRMEDGWYNARIQSEIEKAESISRARSQAGRKGYEARVKHLPSKTQARASTPTPIPILSPEKPVAGAHKDSKAAARPQTRGTRLPSDWIPGPEGVAFCREHRPDLDVMLTSERFRDYWQAQPGQRGVKIDWQATWRNWVRNERREKV